MFIKLTLVSPRTDAPVEHAYVNSTLVREMRAGTYRQVDTLVGIQPDIQVTYIYYTDEDTSRVLETPEQIMALLNGAQMHGASA